MDVLAYCWDSLWLVTEILFSSAYVYVFSDDFVLYSQIKKHIKGGPDHEGGIFTVEAPLHASNVQVVDPVTGYDLTWHYCHQLVFA